MFREVSLPLILPNSNYNLSSKKIRHPTLRAIRKYKNDPSAFRKYTIISHQFFFATVENEDKIKELHKLNLKKAAQENKIPVKTLKENKNFRTEYLYMFSIYIFFGESSLVG